MCDLIKFGFVHSNIFESIYHYSNRHEDYIKYFRTSVYTQKRAKTQFDWIYINFCKTKYERAAFGFTCLRQTLLHCSIEIRMDEISVWLLLKILVFCVFKKILFTLYILLKSLFILLYFLFQDNFEKKYFIHRLLEAILYSFHL